MLNLPDIATNGNRLPRVRALTLDFYGTLATHGDCEEVYARFLPDSLPVRTFRRRFDEEMIAWFDWLEDRDLNGSFEFPTIRVMYRQTFERLFDEFGLVADLDLATNVLMDHVGRPARFPETLAALAQWSEHFELCLVTDADEDMIECALRHTGIAIRHVVTSHRMGAYKASMNSPLFPRALELLGTSPDETVHIGDRRPDLLGAKRHGLRVIHVCRGPACEYQWPAVPDAVVNDLSEAVRVTSGR